MLSVGKDWSKSQDAGFTLIELIVVLVVLGFLVALTGPVLSRSLTGLKLRKAVRELSSVLRHVREQAILDQETYSVRFDLELDNTLSGRGLVEEITESVPEAMDLFALPPEVDLLTFRGIDGQDEGETAWIEFYPDGSSSGGVIELVNREGKGAGQIDLNPFTGLAMVTLGMSDES